MQSQLERALSLVKKTGDRLIVFESPTSESAFVVMGLEQYEDLMECGCGADCQCDHDDYEDQDDFSDFPKEKVSAENFDADLEMPNFEDEAEMPEEEVIDHDLAYREEVQRLTEEELLDKINRDIALWKESQKEAENEPILGQNTDNQPIMTETAETGKNRSKWAIKSEIKDNADEIIEEDRHYLEEVRY